MLRCLFTFAHLHSDALLKHGKHTEAVGAFEAALALRSQGYHAASHNLGSALHALGDFEGAERHFRAAAELRPAAPKGWNALVLVRMATPGRRAEARAAFEEALRLMPASQEYAANLANAADEPKAEL